MKKKIIYILVSLIAISVLCFNFLFADNIFGETPQFAVYKNAIKNYGVCMPQPGFICGWYN